MNRSYCFPRVRITVNLSIQIRNVVVVYNLFWLISEDSSSVLLDRDSLELRNGTNAQELIANSLFCQKLSAYHVDYRYRHHWHDIGTHNSWVRSDIHANIGR